MEPDYTEAERYYQAQKRVIEIRKFYEHLTVYLLCNPIVVAVNLMTSPGYLWCLWSVMGWGIAVVLHGFKVFNYPPFFSKEWEDRKIKELMDKEEESKKQIWK